MRNFSMRGYIIWKRRALSLLCCLLFLFAGCAKDSGVVDIFGSTSDIPNASQLPLPNTADGETGGTLRLNLPDIASLHPLEQVSEAVGNLFSLLFDPAIRVNADGSCSANILESWEISEDGSEYTFSIRKNVAFHDASYGTVDAEDILFCLDYIVKHESAALHAYVDGVESYEKVDDLTIRVRTSGKKRNLPYLFSFYVVPKEYYAQKKASTKALPVGTGAYAVESYAEGESMRLVRNVSWWKVAPAYAAIELTPVAEGRIALGSDVFSDYEMLFTDSLAAGSLGVAGKVDVHQIRTPYLTCLVPNVYNRAMGDANLRRAIAYGVDRAKLISSTLMGLGEATVTPLSENFWAVNKTAQSTAAQDKSLALSYLEKAGYRTAEDGRQYTINSDGTRGYLSLRLLYTPSDGAYDLNGAVAQAIVESLGEIGIRVELVSQDADTYLSTLQKGNFQLALCQFYMYADQDLRFLFRDACNYGNFHDSALQQALTACASALSEEEVQVAFTELQTQLAEKMPVIGLYYAEHCLLADSSISVPSKLCFAKVFQNINEWKQK